MTDSVGKVSVELQELGEIIDKWLLEVTGKKIPFTVFIWTDGFAQYLSSAASREEQISVIEKMIAKWKQGMPDIPAHERN